MLCRVINCEQGPRQRGVTTEARSRLWGKNKFGILSASAVALQFGGYSGIGVRRLHLQHRCYQKPDKEWFN